MPRSLRLALLAAFLLALPSPTLAQPFDACGTFVMGLEGCVLFQPDAGGQQVQPSSTRPAGTRARVQGNLDTTCTSACFAPCIFNAVISSCNPACRADFNTSGSVTVQDLFDFLRAWFAQCTAAGTPGSACQYGSADFNNTSGVTVQDLFDYLAAWFAGC